MIFSHNHFVSLSVIESVSDHFKAISSLTMSTILIQIYSQNQLVPIIKNASGPISNFFRHFPRYFVCC